MNDGGDFISTQWWQLQILTDVRNFDLMSAALISLQVSGIANLPDDRGLVAFVPEQQLHSHWCDQLTTLLEMALSTGSISVNNKTPSTSELGKTVAALLSRCSDYTFYEDCSCLAN